MQEILSFVNELPTWVYVAAAAVVAAVVVVIVFTAKMRRDFMRRLRLAAEDPEQAELQVRQKYSDAQLLRRSALIESVARKYSMNVISATGIDELWQDRLLRKRRSSDFRRVLDYSWENGLFACFLVALERPKLRPRLFARLDDTGDLLVLRSIALSGRGEEFSGHAAFEMFSHRVDEVREMTGDPDWPVRYFAVKILLYDHDPLSERAVWECVNDAASVVRKVIADEFQPSEREGLFEHLYSRLLDDPSYEVRRAARRRIDAEFPERYEIDPSNLAPQQLVHVLEQLHDESKEDENVATTYLAHKSREFRLPAARFLERRGVLSQMLASADLGDRQAFDRTTRLLENAFDVNVTGFLEQVRKPESAPVLLIAARLLTKKGPRSLVAPVAEAGFAHLDDLPEARDELLEALLSMIEKRGDDASLELMRSQLSRRRLDTADAERILSHVPPRAHLIFSDTFFDCLTDPQFAAVSRLVETLARMPYPAVMPDLMDIIKAGREAYPHQVRIRALEAIGAFGDGAVLQFVLENLALLPHGEAREFTRTLAGFAGDEFDKRAGALLETSDAGVRSALISALPATEKDGFLKQIREAVGDADPDVRISAVWALADFNDKRSLAQASDKLRDPVERVRREAARALGAHGGEQLIKQLKGIVTDENEIETVKVAAIQGLGASTLKSSIDILVDTLELGGELQREAVKALASKRGRRDIEAIVNHMKDAEPALRDRLTQVFRVMATDGEDAMVDLLQQDIPSLRPFVTDILEKVGYVESLVRRLAHRSPEVRRNTAEILAFIGTPSAFRGIVLAARDPDQDVRVKVTRALEMLSTDSGLDILEELQNDPDKRVRKYTTWALQRAKAKSS
ncbi:MAG: transposase [Spirochaetes bacterium]|jgi:HEAT repeat protein|nr:transposase [Spirochaetota bacterium]